MPCYHNLVYQIGKFFYRSHMLRGNAKVPRCGTSPQHGEAGSHAARGNQENLQKQPCKMIGRPVAASARTARPMQSDFYNLVQEWLLVNAQLLDMAAIGGNQRTVAR